MSTPSLAQCAADAPLRTILSEATWSPDSESEQLTKDSLRRLRRGRTTFVIAHRLSTIRSTDQIVERGTHEGLLERGGRYRQLYDKRRQLGLDCCINRGKDFAPGSPKPAPVAANEQPGPERL